MLRKFQKVLKLVRNPRKDINKGSILSLNMKYGFLTGGQTSKFNLSYAKSVNNSSNLVHNMPKNSRKGSELVIGMIRNSRKGSKLKLVMPRKSRQQFKTWSRHDKKPHGRVQNWLLACQEIHGRAQNWNKTCPESLNNRSKLVLDMTRNPTEGFRIGYRHAKKPTEGFKTETRYAQKVSTTVQNLVSTCHEGFNRDSEFGLDNDKKVVKMLKTGFWQSQESLDIGSKLSLNSPSYNLAPSQDQNILMLTPVWKEKVLTVIKAGSWQRIFVMVLVKYQYWTFSDCSCLVLGLPLSEQTFSKIGWIWKKFSLCQKFSSMIYVITFKYMSSRECWHTLECLIRILHFLPFWQYYRYSKALPHSV